MSEANEEGPQVPQKIQDIIEKLSTDYDQEDKDPKEELKKNIAHSLQILSRAELWASGLGGNENEANQLMAEGFRRIGALHKDKVELSIIDEIIDDQTEEIRRKNKESVLAKLIQANRHFLHGEEP